MKYSVILFAAASAATLMATGATAQSKAPASAASATAADVGELVVTGSRAEPKSRLETLSPVDVVTAQTLQKRGSTELAAALAATVPSLDFPRPSNTDGTDSVRPLTLRGRASTGGWTQALARRVRSFCHAALSPSLIDAAGATPASNAVHAVEDTRSLYWPIESPWPICLRRRRCGDRTRPRIVQPRSHPTRRAAPAAACRQAQR